MTKVTDLIERLRKALPVANHSANAGLCHEAADRIEAQDAELLRLSSECEALRSGLERARDAYLDDAGERAMFLIVEATLQETNGGGK